MNFIPKVNFISELYSKVNLCDTSNSILYLQHLSLTSVINPMEARSSLYGIVEWRSAVQHIHMVDQRMKLIMIFAWLIKIEINHPHLNMIEFSCIAHLVYPEEHEQPPPATACNKITARNQNGCIASINSSRRCQEIISIFTGAKHLPLQKTVGNQRGWTKQIQRISIWRIWFYEDKSNLQLKPTSSITHILICSSLLQRNSHPSFKVPNHLSWTRTLYFSSKQRRGVELWARVSKLNGLGDWLINA